MILEDCVRRRTVGQNSKNPPKIRFYKVVNITDHTCACIDLTNFKYEVHPTTGNGSYVNLQETCLAGKTCEITSSELIFGGF